MIVAGSIDALLGALGDALGDLVGEGSDVVLLPTAAAYVGATEAAVRTASALESLGSAVEALMVTDRASANETYFADRVRRADLCILLDGSALHARTTWRDSAVGDALGDSHAIAALGACATVLGTHMIDPRGGAPTTGLSLVDDAVFTVRASEDQLARSRHLLGAHETLIVIDADGCVIRRTDGWRQVSEGGVAATRDGSPVRLAT